MEGAQGEPAWVWVKGLAKRQEMEKPDQREGMERPGQCSNLKQNEKVERMERRGTMAPTGMQPWLTHGPT